MSGTHMARWSAGNAGKLLIINPAGNIVDALAIPPGGDRPGPGLLAGAIWAPYPGAEWEEDRPGQWSQAVFRERR
jgi:hypothetical protein